MRLGASKDRHLDLFMRAGRHAMKQHPSHEEIRQQAAPVIKDLVKIQVQHYGMIPVDSLIYAMTRHLALTIAASCDDGDEYREWINALMKEFRDELEEKPKAVA